MSDEVTDFENADGESKPREAQDQGQPAAGMFLPSGLSGQDLERAVFGAGSATRLKLDPSRTRAVERSVAAPATKAPRTRESVSGFDFIQTYIEYADVIEAPPEAHEAVAMQLIAATLNPSVSIEFGGISLPLDLWLLLLSPSGFGRNTLVGLARPIVSAAHLDHLLLNDTWGSKQAFYQNVCEHPSGMFTWPELSVVLKNLADSRFGGVKEWLTDRYDNVSIPEAIRYRSTGKKGDTPSIVFSQAPRLNILATSSLEWFMGNLAQGDAAGGFVPRWVLSQARGPSRVVPIPGTPSMRRPVDVKAHFSSFFLSVCSHSAKPPLSPSFHSHSL
jgi:hypothetical protein